MTNYEHIMSMSVEELASFFNKYNEVDRTPWDNWFEENYCKNCESIKEEENGRTVWYAYCELYDKCKYDTGQIKRFKISERHYLIWGSKYSFKIIN